MKKFNLKKFGKTLALLLSFPAVLPLAGGAISGSEKLVAHAESKNSFPFDENILISVFWPPTENYINDEQYKLLADAGVNWVMGAGEESLRIAENQKKMLQLCAKYGMGMTVADENFGDVLLGKTEEEIAATVKLYENVAGAYGFYMRDEPLNPNVYIDAYVALKKAAPEKYMHMNFLPRGSYSSSEVYRGQMEDWCRLTANAGYPTDYLMFDRYPFPLQEGAMDRVGFFENVRICYEVGLKNDVKTALYIQTVCQQVGFRRPTASETRYEMYASLAFGFKQLSFFTWFTPAGRDEPFINGIISADGIPNENYDAIKTINHEILAIGSTLVKCDALEVYFNGPDTYGQPSVPSDFFVKAADDDSVILSFLRHKETGRNYLMVVNNDYSASQNVELTFNDEIKSLFEVSKKDGSLNALAMDGQKLNLDLAAGDAMFIALPEDFDHYEEKAGQPDAKTNLATDAMIHAPTSVGSGGWYISFLQDGNRKSSTDLNGWKSENTDPTYLKIDLGRTLNFNRIDLYPTGGAFDQGTTLPSHVDISVSDDGENWTKVKTISDLKVKNMKGVKIDVDTQNARYIRLDLSGSNGGSYLSLSEIEIYNDDGSVPAPEEFKVETEEKVITYKKGSNIALNKDVYCSSTTSAYYEQWDWAPRFVNDGKSVTGWTSNICMNTSPFSSEYILIDFGDVFAVEKISLGVRGAFPEDYHIDLSENGLDWTVVEDVKGSPEYQDGAVVTTKLESPVAARYVRVTGTKLRGGGNDGFLMQLGEIRAYGDPICDTTAIKEAVAKYEAKGGDKSNEYYKEATEGIENGTLTRTYANQLTENILALADELQDISDSSEPLVSDSNESESSSANSSGKTKNPILLTSIIISVLVLLGVISFGVIRRRKK